MLKRLMFLAALASAPAMAVAAVQAEAPQKLNSPGALFGMRDAVSHMDISPDGGKAVYLAPGAGRITTVYIADLATGAVSVAIQASGDPDRFNWCNFVTNDRLICQVSGIIDDVGLLVPFSRLIALDIDGKNLAQLGQRSSFYDASIRQFDGQILDWLPDEDGAVLMAREYVPEVGRTGSNIVRTAEGLGIDRIDVRTMKTKVVEVANRRADFYISDGRGNVRIKGYRPERGSTGQLADRLEYSYRLPDSRGWKDFSTVTADGDGMIPLEVDATTNSAYALKKLNGRYALYRVKLDGSMATELVYANDKVDVEGVVRIGRGSRVIGVSFAEEEYQVVYFDEEYKKLAAALGKAIPDRPLINFVGSSNDNQQLLIFAGSDAHPGSYYVYDKAERTLNEIMLVRPNLEKVKLASVKPVTYPAADGTPIPGYLTLPAGKEAKNLPVVVMPHGGPASRDVWGFDWMAQYFAHQGYAVLQPNFRGSDGYGDAWRKTHGFKEWQTSIGDVTAGARWLAAQGIGDPAKMAIVGWSYGGYAALQSGVAEPDLFKAIVAIAPVTDLQLAKEEVRHYTNARNVAEYIGTGPHVTQGSPLRNAERIKAPVLLFHGDKDLNVGVDHSRRMDAALRKAGKTSNLTIYEGLEHSLVDSTARAQMLDSIGSFLAASMK